MDFMELLKEWLDLRDDLNNATDGGIPIPEGIRKRERMDELEYEINRRLT